MSTLLLPPSRLPQVGTTIFTTMSALAAKHGAVNLDQGFPDFECDPQLVDCVTQAMQRGANQYAPMPLPCEGTYFQCVSYADISDAIGFESQRHLSLDTTLLIRPGEV